MQVVANPNNITCQKVFHSEHLQSAVVQVKKRRFNLCYNNYNIIQKLFVDNNIIKAILPSMQPIC